MAFREVFEAKPAIGEKVCVLGPGPKGKAHYHRIPADYRVIACNKAVLVEDLKCDVWVLTHGDQEWIEAALAHFDGMRIFSEAAARRTQNRLAGAADCYFFVPEEREKLRGDVMLPIENLVRYGATVTGNAVQLAWNLGAREFLLCGVDMSGDGYWDGTQNPQPMHGDTWIAVPNFNLMMRYLEKQGVRFATLSETRLNVPSWDAVAGEVRG